MGANPHVGLLGRFTDRADPFFLPTGQGGEVFRKPTNAGYPQTLDPLAMVQLWCGELCAFAGDAALFDRLIAAVGGAEKISFRAEIFKEGPGVACAKNTGTTDIFLFIGGTSTVDSHVLNIFGGAYPAYVPWAGAWCNAWFAEIAKAIRDQVLQPIFDAGPVTSVTICGHSQGAAAANILARALRMPPSFVSVQVLSMGEPRGIGDNPTWSLVYDHFRLVTVGDVVDLVPPQLGYFPPLIGAIANVLFPTKWTTDGNRLILQGGSLPLLQQADNFDPLTIARYVSEYGWTPHLEPAYTQAIFDYASLFYPPSATAPNAVLAPYNVIAGLGTDAPTSPIPPPPAPPNPPPAPPLGPFLIQDFNDPFGRKLRPTVMQIDP